MTSVEPLAVEHAPIIALSGVAKKYLTPFGEVIAASDVSLTVRPGEMLVLVGASGSGKTTLLNLMAGLVSPDEGDITVAGVDVANASVDRLISLRRNHVSVIFQEYNLVALLTAAENISLPLTVRGVSKAEAAAAADQALAAVGLPQLGDRFPAELSGGQRQRVAIARALALPGEVVLADEPTGSVDTSTARGVMSALHDLRTAGRAVVVATHDPAFREVADRVLTVRDGEVGAMEGVA
ncbi:ATP-binding cassette domain-containing protein [Nakamurella aerolata]|uniref:ABC transporter ATP-binding protein n=1 Tax=Nakamurella aerolata TaxID=1656892 RepID=A0A849ABG3_9ACTN|nr:ABC transporter ATP-binding protein [Nakamurella aerolata]